MASHLANFFLIPLAFFLLLVASSAIFCGASRLNTVVAPLVKDSSTNQYVMEIARKTPLQKEKVVLDLGGDILWVQCKNSYKSSTYLPLPCHTPLCTASGSGSFTGCGDCSTVPPGTSLCRNNTCMEKIYNYLSSQEKFTAELSQDAIAMSPSDGKNELSPKAVVPNFAFTCVPLSFLRGLANGVAGMAGMNWKPLALPFQLTVALEIERKFGLCLPKGGARGAVFFGAPPYLQGPDKQFPYIKLNYTFLVSPKYPSEYYLKVNGIQINGKKLDIDPEELRLDLWGGGGTKLSTLAPYTQARTPIYAAIRDEFVREAEAAGMVSVAAVKPFDACFDANSVGYTKVGPAVPVIDLVLDNEYVFWRIYGANSMEEAKPGVLCLAFVDAGEYTDASIVIGGHQLQDNLLQFDLIEFKLFFSSSLLASNTACSNFNFTSNALPLP